MKLYSENGYINQDEILARNEVFVYEVGGRGIGKTYGILKNLVVKGRMIYLRRTQTEADLVMNDVINPFKRLNEDFPMLQISTDRIAQNLGGIYKGLDAEKKLVGYIAALSTFSNIRGADFSDVEYIFLDEFIPEKQARPIKEEYFAMLNLYESVNRNRELEGRPPVKLICAANSNKIDNPIFIGLGVVNIVYKAMQKGIETYFDNSRNLAVYMFMRSPISVKKADTVLYKLAAGSNSNAEFSAMAIANKFAIDDQNIHPRAIIEYKPICRVGEMEIWQHKSREEFYIKCGTAKIKEEYTTSSTDILRFTKLHAYLFFGYMQNQVIFEDAVSLVLFKHYF